MNESQRDQCRERVEQVRRGIRQADDILGLAEWAIDTIEAIDVYVEPAHQRSIRRHRRTISLAERYRQEGRQTALEDIAEILGANDE